MGPVYITREGCQRDFWKLELVTARFAGPNLIAMTSNTGRAVVKCTDMESNWYRIPKS